MIFDHKLKSVFPFFFSEIVRSKVVCDVLARKVSILNQKNVDLKKLKIWHFSKGVSPWFLSKIENFVPVYFFSKIVQNKVFCDLLDRKLANLAQKNIDFKNQKIGIFPKGLVYGFWSKIGNYVPVQVLSKPVQNKVFCELVDRNLAI